MTTPRQITLTPAEPATATRQGGVQFIGTATTLIQHAGFTLLTDPNFIHMHEQVDLGNGLHATRLTNPALDISQLPPVDAVLLSHFHGDHFDQVAERELNRTLPIITTPEAAEKLQERGFTNALPLETWASVTLSKGDAQLRVTATPGRHGPPLVNMLLPDVMGSILEFTGGSGQIAPRMYFSGDTLVFDDLHEIPRRYPEIDLALLHLGGTRALGILVTMDAEQGIEAMRIIAPKLTIPIHYNDYDVFKSPLEDFQRAVEAAGLSDRVHYLAHGERYQFPR